MITIPYNDKQDWRWTKIYTQRAQKNSQKLDKIIKKKKIKKNILEQKFKWALKTLHIH